MGQNYPISSMVSMKRLSPDMQPTMKQIQELAAMREEAIRKTGLPVSVKHLCYKLRIYPTKVRILAPELYENWNDINFRWKGPK